MCRLNQIPIFTWLNGSYYILFPYFRSKAALTYCFWGTAKKHSEPGSLAFQDEWMGVVVSSRSHHCWVCSGKPASLHQPIRFFKAQQWVRGLICHPPYLPQRIDLSVFRGQRPQQGNVALVPSLGLEIEWTPWTFNMSAPPSYQILHVLKCWATCTKANSFQSHSGVLSISKLLPTYFLCRDKLWPGWSSHFTKDEGRQ